MTHRITTAILSPNFHNRNYSLYPIQNAHNLANFKYIKCSHLINDEFVVHIAQRFQSSFSTRSNVLLHMRGAWIGSGRSHGLLITHCLPTRYRKPIYFRRPGTREAVDYDPHTLSLSRESSSINTLFRVVSKTLRWCAACRAPPKNTRLRGPALSPSARTRIGTAIKNNFPKHLAPRPSILHRFDLTSYSTFPSFHLSSFDLFLPSPSQDSSPALRTCPDRTVLNSSLLFFSFGEKEEEEEEVFTVGIE